MSTRPSQRESILIVDDTTDNLRLLTTLLEEHGYDPRPVPSGKLALQAVERELPDLVLLDVNMPEMNGYEVCERLKADARTRDIPVVFVSAMSEIGDKMRAFGGGAVDYVTKPFQFDEVLARVNTHLALARTRRELAEKNARLLELETLRDNLVHMVVHDMRSPLTVLLGGLALLRDDLAGKIGDASAEDLESSYGAAETLKHMVNELLDVSRLEKKEMPVDCVRADLAALVRRVVATFAHSHPARAIELHAPAALVTECDEALVTRVFDNLIEHAFARAPKDRPIELSLTLAGNVVRVTVRDEGMAIPRDSKERIFQKFGALKERAEGRRSIGLGHAFCRLAVLAHGGEIGVESEEGKGNTFWFTLPAK